MYAEFEIFSSNRFRDMEGSQNSKIRSRDPFTTLFDLILHFLDNVPCNQSVCEI